MAATYQELFRSGNDFVRHNAWQLIRIFPSGLRTDSSNYNPQAMWNVGCQMVALNFQTAGTEMDLYDGLFIQNGRCGYVLKPNFLRDTETNFSPGNPQSSGNSSPLTLAIKVSCFPCSFLVPLFWHEKRPFDWPSPVTSEPGNAVSADVSRDICRYPERSPKQIISGQQLPKIDNNKEGSIVDPFVRVEIHGVPADSAKQETRYIENNGFNPQWGESFQFQVWVPELALLRFVVEDYDKATRNDFVGQYTLPLTCVKAGYRHIHLLSKDGTGIPPASLFVHIHYRELPTE